MKTERLKNFLLCLFAVFFIYDCSQKKVPENPEELYNEAMKKLEGSIFTADYDTAEQYFEKIIELFPGTKYVPDANFGIAYAKMKKGDCAEAAVLFESFYQKYTSHQKAPLALYYSIKCYMKFVDTPDRDITYAEKVRVLSSLFLQNYKDNEKKDEISKIHKEVLEIIAQHHLSVAEFYIRRKVYPPATRRIKIILEDRELSETEPGKKAKEIYEKLIKDKKEFSDTNEFFRSIH